VLREYLACFRDRGDGRHFLDLEAARTFGGGDSVFCLLGYLLDGAGLIEHSGSVVSSAWLTPLGIEVKGRIEADPDGDWSEGES
jgi:hypothetical protein